MLQEFKKFAMRGNVIDMAVGIIIGGAFTSIVKSLVADIIMPPIGMMLGGVNFNHLMLVISQGVPHGPYVTLSEAQAAGAVTINYGVFINAMISFLIVAFAVFLLVKGINRLRDLEKKDTEAEPAAATTKECPYCISTVALSASRCPHCTSQLPPEA